MTSWKRWTPRSLTILSAFLMVIAFPPWSVWPLLWVCFIPFFIVLKRASTVRDALVQGIWLSYFGSLGGFYWVAFVLKEFAGAPWVLSILALQVFCIFCEPQFFVFAGLYKKLEKMGTFRLEKTHLCHAVFLPFILALAYAGIDWILPKLFMDTLGDGFYRAKFIRQLADLGGVFLLTFLLFYMNYSLWKAWENFRESYKDKKRFQLQWILPLGVAVSIFGISLIYGILRYNQVTNLLSQAKLGVQAAAIQGNIGDFDKIAAENGIRDAAIKVVDTFTLLTDQALRLNPPPDLVIWPETSYPSTFGTPHSMAELRLDQQIHDYVYSHRFPLLFGGYDHSHGKDYNAFFFLSPSGHLQIYRKNILLLFGEYIPGAGTFQFLRDAFPQVGNFGRGPGPEVFDIETSNPKVGKVQIGPIICYEALFPNYVIHSARKGSQIIMNITNDSWFGSLGEPQLHLALSSFRSIETRLPMLRTTNTGISALIMPDGEITNATGVGTQEIMNVHVPLTQPIPTLMKLWGDWFGLFALVSGFLGIGWLYRLSQSKS